MHHVHTRARLAVKPLAARKTVPVSLSCSALAVSQCLRCIAFPADSLSYCCSPASRVPVAVGSILGVDEVARVRYVLREWRAGVMEVRGMNLGN